MRLDEFYSQIRNAGPDVQEFELLLAQADPTPGDDVEVQISEIGWIEVDYDAGQIRIFPRSAVTEDTPDQQIPSLEGLLQLLPFAIDENNALEFFAELPLDRGSPGLIRTAMSEVYALHLAKQSAEAWLLLSPSEVFGNEVLPA